MSTTTTTDPDAVFDIDAVPEQHRARVQAMIPDPILVEGYVNRELHGRLDFDVFDGAKSMMQNIVMAGPTGSGKTLACKAYAASRQVPFARISFNGSMDPNSVLGMVNIDEGTGDITWKDGEAPIPFRYGGVVLLDEIDLAVPKITAAFHQTLDGDRRMTLIDHAEVIKAHPDVMIFGAHNPGYTGTARMNQAFIDRFDMPVEWGYDAAVEDELIGAYSPRLMEVARGIRDLPEVRSPVSTRALQAFVEQVQYFDVEFAINIFLNKFDDVERVPVARAMEAQSFAIEEEFTAVLG